MGLLGVFRKERHKDGYLAEDDVVIEKAFARKLSWAGWTYSFAKKRKVYGLHIVVVLWCSFDGRLRILVAFRLWRPRRSCAPRLDRTKLKSWRRSCSSRSSVRGCAPNTASSTLITASLQRRMVYQGRGKTGVSGWELCTLARSYSGAVRGDPSPS